MEQDGIERQRRPLAGTPPFSPTYKGGLTKTINRNKNQTSYEMQLKKNDRGHKINYIGSR